MCISVWDIYLFQKWEKFLKVYNEFFQDIINSLVNGDWLLCPPIFNVSSAFINDRFFEMFLC